MADNSEFNKELTLLESGGYQPEAAPDENTWNEVWKTKDVSSNDTMTTALIGGALADRLAWVFHAGYQGMMRYAFPFCPRKGWASYLVAEDKTGEYPGTTLSKAENGRILSGFKSWVAASDHVDHLVVQVAGSDDNTLVLVERDDQGVSLSSREKPGFLGDLSQGFAAFENVFIDQSLIFSSEKLHPNFSQSEPLHVLTALNAFMLSQTLALEGNDSIQKAASRSLKKAGDLVARGAVDDEFFLGIADLDEETTETARSFEAFVGNRNEQMLEAWQKDRGLVNMFSRGLQKRAKWLREK